MFVCSANDVIGQAISDMFIDIIKLFIL